MKKSLGGIAVILVLHAYCYSQNMLPGDRVPMPGDEKNLLINLQQSQPGIPQVEIMLDLSACYLYLPGEEKKDMDKATAYARQAKQLSTQLNFRDGYNEAMVLSAETLMESAAIDESWKAVLDSALISVKSTLGQVRGMRNARREARALRQLGTIYFRQGKYHQAETEFLNMIKLCKANQINNLHYTYHRLAIMNTFYCYDNNKALHYALEALKSMENTGDYKYAGPVYRSLGYIYRLTGMFQKAVDCINKSMQYYNINSSSVQLELADYASSTLLKMHRDKDALLLLHKTIQQFPPRNDHDLETIDYALGYCYRSLKMYDSAEFHFNRLIDRKMKDGTIDHYNYKAIGQLYVESGQLIRAKPYLDIALTANPSDYSVSWFAHLHFLHFKVDSASGNYLSAINHLMKNKALDDIEYEQSKVRNNQELQIKYETEKKDQDILLKTQSILLLNRLSDLQKKDLEQAGLKLRFETTSKEQSLKLANAEADKKDKDLLVKQQNIELLKKEKLLQQSSLSKAKTGRNILIGGAAMLLLLLSMLYNRYRQKQITTMRLEAQQRDIHSKNAELLKLVVEKEWLLKEVHHRVKNNLHTVMSLLESQSAYLQNDALAAIQESQHRVYSMSLIHQKLYQSEDVTTIDMSVYLPELTNYLAESFNVGQHIRFNLQIEPVELDVSQAIPVGLIVNEAITNSIKYAFPLTNNNEIVISMTSLPGNKIVLIISDNGIGLPADFDISKTDSLGIKLMRGLTKDIGGDFTLENSTSCKISIEFTIDTPLHDVQKLTKPDKA